MVVTVRPRRAADLDACVALAREVHDLDGYPPRMVGGFERFVGSPTALAAFVAVDGDGAGGRVVGHVCVNPASSPEVMALAARSLHLDGEAIGVVARLFVAPSARRGGVARRLLDTAAAECRRLDRHPVLDVATHFAPAIALYERSGWRHAGRVVVDVGDGRRFEEHVYLAP